MKDSIELLKTVGKVSCPPIELEDLQQEVLSSIRRHPIRDPFSLKMIGLAAVPVLASLGIAVVMWLEHTDPLNELMSQFMVVMR